MKIRIKRSLKAFTLVELIIVITILAILATIAFTSFQGYMKDARDSQRLSTLSSVKKGIEILKIQTGNYPQPEGELLTGSINNQILTYVGEIKENTSRMIRSSATPKDPLTNTNIIYGTTSDYKYYQMATILENPTSYNNLITQTYAETLLQANVEGDYPGYIKFSSGSDTYIANIPSLIFNNTGSVDLLSTNTYYVVNKKSNLPYNEKGVKDTSTQNVTTNKLIKEITKSENATLTGVKITNLTKDNFETIFTGAILESFNKNGVELANITNLKESVKQNILGTQPTQSQTPSQPTPTPPSNSCATPPTYTNATFTEGTPTEVNQVWQGTTPSNPCYYTCGVGKVLVGNDCLSESCGGTTPDGTAKVSNATSTAGGTWSYNTTPGVCTYACNTGYHTEDSGNTCVSNTRACTITNGEGSQTWTTSWGTCSVVSCNSGYYNAGSSCEQQWSGDVTSGFIFKDTSGTMQYPTSCNNLLTSTWQNTFIGSPWNGTKFVDGVYYIKPDSSAAFKVYCDMTTDGGGWTLAGKTDTTGITTTDKNIIWNGNWNTYTQLGYGNFTGNIYWLPLINWYKITNNGSNHELILLYGNGKKMGVTGFQIISSTTFEWTWTGIKSGYVGFLDAYKNMKFTTHDNDQDIRTSNCAKDNVGYNGGFWYQACYQNSMLHSTSVVWDWETNGVISTNLIKLYIK